jgi:CheY-like chemotaxis protein/nitrogen-specific signal transduction histidine kinase
MIENHDIDVLVVEDDYLVLREMLRCLDGLGYRVAAQTANGQEALDAIRELKPDVILMDINMPVMDGLEASRHIQATCPTPIVIITAYDTSAMLDQASNAGVGAYLRKPVESLSLHQAITIAMARHKDMMKWRSLCDELAVANRALDEKQRLLSETERLGKIGGWDLNVATLDVSWTESTYRIHEVDDRYVPTVEKGISFYNPDCRARLKDAMERAIEHGVPFDLELSITTAKNNVRDLHVLGSADVGSGTIGGFIQDITERLQLERREKEMSERLADAERISAVGVLAGGIAHDLNNVLGPIVMLPELIEEDLEDAINGDANAKVQIAESLHAIESSAKRAAAEVKDLVALGKQSLCARVPIRIDRLPHIKPDSAIDAELRSAFPEVLITRSAPTDSLMVLGSSDHLARVLSNLMRNAAESIAESGEVTVRAYREELKKQYDGYVMIPSGDYAVIDISDTGQGIPRGDLPRIFEPFFSRKAKSNRSGTGLGLAIVRGIVDQHEGFIDVRSEHGQGTVISVYLPLLSDSVPSATASKQTQLTRGAARVLVIDDEPVQRHLAKAALGRLGYAVSLAEDGRQGVELIRQQASSAEVQYDIVLLDMVMREGFDGLDTLKAILKLNPAQKVIIVSGHADNDRIRETASLGAEFLAKPYSRADLAASIRRHLDGE